MKKVYGGFFRRYSEKNSNLDFNELEHSVARSRIESALFPILSFIKASCYIIVSLCTYLRDKRYYLPHISKLCIDENEVYKRCMGIKTRVVKRDNLYIKEIDVDDTKCYAFANIDLSQYSRYDIFSLTRKRKVIIYPCYPEMVIDFPEIFNYKF